MKKAKAEKKKSFLCDICGKILSSYQSHYVHTQNHRTDKRYVCLICGASFNTCSKLCRHRKAHTGYKRSRDYRNKPHKCSQCDKAYRALDCLKAHELTAHSNSIDNSETLPCPNCSRSYNHPYLLERHINSAHLRKPHVKCQYCPSLYKRKRSLLYHLKTAHKEHFTDNTTFLCTTCGKNFASKDSLLRHQKLHNNEKPYTCRTCNKSFAQSGNLKAHENTHSNQKPFRCDVCGKGFNQKSNLNTHRKKSSCTITPN